MKKQRTIALGFALWLGSCNARQEHVELNKIYYHKEAGGSQLGLGKVLFHFTKEPTMNPLPTHGASEYEEQELLFFFPTLKIASGAQAMVEELNALVSPWYKIWVEEVKKPIAGVKLHLKLDPKQVTYTWDTCDSIVTLANGRKEKCLVLKFFNKKCIELLARQPKPVTVLADNKKRGVIIDCGHGGTDNGAIGYGAIKEKDITIDVGLKVAHLLKDQGVSVFLTRKDDSTIRLDERTALSNKLHAHADLFVSIHANFSGSPQASGIETFCLDASLFKPHTHRLNAVENQIITHTTTALYKQSVLLANALHANVLECVKKKQRDVIDRAVKYQVAQVLVGSVLPAALIEIGFVSNKKEAELLRNAEYQELVARGISSGILAYLQQVPEKC